MPKKLSERSPFHQTKKNPKETNMNNRFYLLLRTLGRGAKRHQFEESFELKRELDRYDGLPEFEVPLDRWNNGITVETVHYNCFPDGHLLQARCPKETFDAIVKIIKEQLGPLQKKTLQFKIAQLE